MINLFTRNKTQDEITSVDTVWNKRNNLYKLYNSCNSEHTPDAHADYSYNEILDHRIIHCSDSDVVDRALKYQTYLIKQMGVSIETSAHCTLDLYFPLLTTKQGV